MTVSHLLDEHYFLCEASSHDLNQRENSAGSPSAGPSRQHDEMGSDSTEMVGSLGTIQEISQTLYDPIQVSPFKKLEQHLLFTYRGIEKDTNRQGGASNFLGYLESQSRSLGEVTVSDLERWALTPITRGKGGVPSIRAFEGAKGLCALAAQFRHIDAHKARELSTYSRPQFDLESLRAMVQNPKLTHNERDYYICLKYQSGEKNPSRLAGANGLLAYLTKQQRSLADVSARDLQQWGRTFITTGAGKDTVPSARAFEGAQALCAMAAKVGHLDAQQAKDVAACTRPRVAGETLRFALQNPALTRQEREYHIYLAYKSSEKDSNRQAGANALLTYLTKQQRSLAEVSTSDLEQWALTPISKSKVIVPSAQAFQGAKALCALAVEVGYIAVQRANDLAQCVRPHPDLDALRILLQNPALTPKEREYHIHLNFQRVVHDARYQMGASTFMAYLERQARPLAEVTTSDLEQWALTPSLTGVGKGNVPTARAFEGAKQLCALAAEVGHVDAQQARKLAELSRPPLNRNFLRMALQDPTLTPQERDYHIRLHYFSAEPQANRHAGANGILAYLHNQQRSLAEITTKDLQEWALTPTATRMRSLPTTQGFDGAKALCALAAEVGYIDPPMAKNLATCTRSQGENRLQSRLRNPTLTAKERDYHIRLTFQSGERNFNRLAGANGILAYLHKQNRTLPQLTPRDLEQWRLTPIAKGKGKGNLSNPQVFEGALALCALAAEVGHIDPQSAKDLAACKLPQLNLESLRIALQNPALTAKERDYNVRLSYQTLEKNVHRQAGASGILAFLERQEKSLAEVSKSDLEKWALTPIVTSTGKSNLPSAQAVEGAKALCILAAQAGYIDARRVQDIAQCRQPLPDALAANAITAKVHKRRRINDLADSQPLRNSFALPDNDDLYRERILSPPMSHPIEHAASSYMSNTQALIEEIESLANIDLTSSEFLSKSLQVKGTISGLILAEPQSIQLAKDALADSNPAAFRRLLDLELELELEFLTPLSP